MPVAFKNRDPLCADVAPEAPNIQLYLSLYSGERADQAADEDIPAIDEHEKQDLEGE
ncbi:hypothetical protein J2X72_004673 [Phyllobacterium sp. 1468]|nr:hypothetical protein [Phyllobacterium sp. 1468]